MSNSVVEDFKNKEDQKNAETNDNTSRRYHPVRNGVKLALLLVALGVLAPTPVQAKGSFSSQSLSFSDEEAKVEIQNEITYTEEEIRKGTENVNKLIASYESEYKYDGKTTKSDDELNNSRYVANVLRSLDPNSLGKCSENAEILQYGEDRFNFIALNDEIVYCELEDKNVTEDLKNGSKNLSEQIENLQLDYTQDGKIKSAKKQDADKKAALFLGEYLITREELSNIMTLQNKGIRNLSSKEQNSLSRGYLIIYRKLQFLAKEFNEQCDLEIFIDEENFKIRSNGTKYLVFSEKGPSGWRDDADVMNGEVKKVTSSAYQQ